MERQSNMTPPLSWLVDRVAAGRMEIRAGYFFRRLNETSSVRDLQHYFDQLAWFSPQFIAALLARAASEISESGSFVDLWREHAGDEADHPAQLRRWLVAHEMVSTTTGLNPTRETVELAALCMWSATREWRPSRVLRLNLVAEGVALDVFSATLGAFERLKIDPGPGTFWRSHRSVDARHMMIGMDLIPDYELDTQLGRHYAETVDHTLERFARMLDTW